MDEVFSKNLKYILDKKLSTPNKIIKATGHKSTSIVTMWKNNERNIMPQDLVKIANLLGYTIDQLYNQDLETILKDENSTFIDYIVANINVLTKDDKDSIYLLINKRKKNE